MAFFSKQEYSTVNHCFIAVNHCFLVVKIKKRLTFQGKVSRFVCILIIYFLLDTQF